MRPKRFFVLILLLCAGSAEALATGDGAELAVTSPREYQVFQRATRLRGSILVRGSAPGARSIEVRVSGPSLRGDLPARWISLPVHADSGEFDARVQTGAGGFYQVQVRRAGPEGKQLVTAVGHVGVGEVFVIAGQSNATNYGEVQQRSETGMVTNFDGTSWRLADDPQAGVQDRSSRGSFMPAFGDELYRLYGVPVGVAPVGHGSTSVRQWLPKGDSVRIMPTMKRYVVTGRDGELVSDGTLFDGMMLRIRQFGPHGFRALLWHQGESDCHQPAGHEIAAGTYRTMMSRVIKRSRAEAGWRIPWMVAEATYHTPDDTGCAEIRTAQRSLWRSGLALEGPDTDGLTAGYREKQGKGTHFNDAGLKAHGRLWAESVSRSMDLTARP